MGSELGSEALQSERQKPALWQSSRLKENVALVPASSTFCASEGDGQRSGHFKHLRLDTTLYTNQCWPVS